MGQFYSAIMRIPAFALSLCGMRRKGRLRLTDVDEESAPVAITSTAPVAQNADSKLVHIAVMGPTGSGKSTFVNLVSGSSLGVGQGLESCTSEVQASNPFSIDGKKVVLVDTPGFGDTTLADSDIWKIIAASLVTSHRAGVRLAGVIYMQRISDVKVSGSARQSFKMFQELCGEETYPNVVLVTGMWDTVASDVGHSREQELASKEIFFKPMLEKGARMMRHDNTHASALAIVQSFLDKSPVTLRIQKELGAGGDILQTSIYKQIHGVMLELVTQRQKKLDTLMAEMAEAVRNEDEETREELEEEVEAAKVELQEARDKASRLGTEYEVELRRLEETLRRRRSTSRVY